MPTCIFSSRTGLVPVNAVLVVYLGQFRIPETVGAVKSFTKQIYRPKLTSVKLCSIFTSGVMCEL